MNPNSVFESKEMYLESILLLMQGNVSPRAKDVARQMGFSRPSVSRALASLERSGYIARNGKEEISFTPSGRALAESVYEKHRVLTRFLTLLDVSGQTAEKDACKFEHVISDETFSRIKDFVAKVGDG